jgi:cyanophycin synthetase
MWRAIAVARGARFTEMSPDLWEVSLGSAATRIRNHEMEFDNPVILGLAGNKTLVHRLLADAGLAVPAHAVFSLADLRPAHAFLAEHPQGCVVKPANGYGGQGVTTHVQRPEELTRAALLASLYSAELLIEVQVPGESYRLLVLEGEVIHAVCRRGPRLQGNGSSTVRQLVGGENARRKTAGELPIEIDRDCVFTLGYQRLSLDSVPGDGAAFAVKSVNAPAGRKHAEVRTVYTETVTEAICSSIKRDAERAARLVESDFLGVDVIMTDPAVPLRASGGVINEVNTTPALHHHYDAARERFPEVALQALAAILRRKGTQNVRVAG